MVTERVRVVFAVLLGCVFLGLAPVGCAQAEAPKYPTKGIDLIVAYGPGGGTDLSARLIAPYLSKKWGQSISVVNLPGASTLTGTKRMMDAAPDGYTLLLDTNSSSSIQGAVMASLPYKWDDRTWVGTVTAEPVSFFVRADAPWKSLKDVTDYAKSKPGALKWSAAGLTGMTVFAMALLLQESGVKLADTNVAMFDSGGEALNAVAGGHADITATSLSGGVGLLEAKRVKLLATTLPERQKGFPEAPTVKEAGYKFDITTWHGVTGPAKLPSYVAQKWVDGIAEATKDPQFLETAAKQYKIVMHLGPDEFKKLVLGEHDKYLPIAEGMGIRK